MSTQLLSPANVFWLIAGLFAGIALSISFSAFWRKAAEHRNLRSTLVYAGSGLAVLAVALYIYAQVGRPDAVNSVTASAPHASSSSADSPSAPESMEAATARLATRLASNGGTEADWQLLAQSYDFLGQAAQADQARNHVVASAEEPGTPRTATATVINKEGIALLAAANTQRIQRRYAEARASYEKLIALNGMTADAWADYADVLASQGEKTQLSGAAAEPIRRALELNPDHPKALWLSASLAHEEHRYGDALGTWRHLRRIIGDNESDAKLIDANIAEAELLAATNSQTKPKTSNKTNASSAGATIVGTIDIDPKLAAKVTAGSTLFIYAKNVDQQGPPLAVYRTDVRKWPVQFKLDDSMAMLPARNLSSAQSVFVEARISKSGQATAMSGDLQASALRINVREAKNVRLRIDKEVG